MKRFSLALLASAMALNLFACSETGKQNADMPSEYELAEMMPLTITNKGKDETYMAGLIESTQFDYAIYVVPGFRFNELEGCDSIEPISESIAMQPYSLQLYTVDPAEEEMQDYEQSGFNIHYERKEVGDKTMQLVFCYLPEAADEGLEMLRAMAGSIIDIPKIYKPSYQEVLSQWKFSANNGFQNLPSAAVFKPESIKNIVYAYKDINQDGTPELIIASYDGPNSGQPTILDIITFNGIQTVRILRKVDGDGSTPCLAKENKLAMYKSSSADSYSFTIYKILPNTFDLEQVCRFGLQGKRYFYDDDLSKELEVKGLIDYWVFGLEELEWMTLWRNSATKSM